MVLAVVLTMVCKILIYRISPRIDLSWQEKKEKKSKKDKKKSKDDSEGGDKDYLKEAMFGKKENDLGIDSDDEDETSVASEAGVDDSGAMSKSRTCHI